MGLNYDALPNEAKVAVAWKARQNLSMAMADGNDMAMNNQEKFLENNQESIATNGEGLRHVIREYKDNLATILDD